MSEIVPAILPKDKEDLREKVLALPSEIKFIHLDVLERDIWTDINIDFEVHLMVKEPEKIIEKWFKREAKRIIVHELNEKINKFRDKIEIGLAVELNIPIKEIFPLILQVDFIHLMSIAEIGEQGHPLDTKVFDRIRQVRDKFPKVTVSVDGGVSTGNYQKLKDAGADRLVVGSGFKDLWQLLRKK